METKLYDKEEIEFYKWHLDFITGQGNMADNKANFLLAIFLSMFGIICSGINKISGFFYSPVSNLYKFLIAGTGILFLVLVIKFVCHFIDTIRPRMEPRKTLKDASYKSLIFWGDICENGIENFRNKKIEDFYGDIKNSIFVNSCIAKEKFENVRIMYKILLPTLITFLILLVCIF